MSFLSICCRSGLCVFLIVQLQIDVIESDFRNLSTVNSIPSVMNHGKVDGAFVGGSE